MEVKHTHNIGNYNGLKPFRFWCQKVLPLVYDDSLSYYELLCKVISYLNTSLGTMNENVESLLNAFIELQEFVETYFNELDVTAEIEDYLNEHLDNILTQWLLNNIPLNQIFVKNEGLWYCGTLDDGYGAEGGVYIGDNIIVTVHNNSNDKVVLRKINYKTKTLVDEKLTNFNHGNSPAYIDGYIYLCENTNIIKLDTEFNIISITDCGVGLLGLTMYNDVLYGRSGDGIYDLSDLENPKLLFNFYNEQGTYPQGIYYDGNFFYLCYTEPEYISVYTLTGLHANTLGFPSEPIDGIYVREIENLFMTPDGLYAYIFCGKDTSGGNIFLSSICPISLTNPLIERKTGGTQPYTIGTFYLSNEAGIYQDGTRDYPYRTSAQALYYQPMYNEIILNLLSDIENISVYGTALRINGNNNSIDLIADYSQLRLESCVLTNLSIANTNAVIVNSTIQNNSINFSNVKYFNTTPKTSNINNSKLEIGDTNIYDLNGLANSNIVISPSYVKNFNGSKLTRINQLKAYDTPSLDISNVYFPRGVIIFKTNYGTIYDIVLLDNNGSNKLSISIITGTSTIVCSLTVNYANKTISATYTENGNITSTPSTPLTIAGIYYIS